MPDLPPLRKVPYDQNTRVWGAAEWATSKDVTKSGRLLQRNEDRPVSAPAVRKLPPVIPSVAKKLLLEEENDRLRKEINRRALY